MGMLKGDSSALNFDQLMAQATQVAKQQDASLMERARQKRREDDDRRRRDERASREREEAQALNRRRELQEKQKKTIKGVEKKRVSSLTSTTAQKLSSLSRTSTSTVKKGNPISFFPEKKKPVHMSFDDLMKKAKEQSLSKGGKDTPKTLLPAKKYASHDIKSSDTTPTLYHRLKRPEATKSPPSPFGNDTMSARERAKILVSEPPKKLNVQKRDRRTIADIQREIRHNKGIHSDDEDDTKSRKDPRLMGSSSSSSKHRPVQQRRNSPPPSRKRPMSPPQPQPPRPGKRLPQQQHMDKRQPLPPVRRMPFSGKPLDAAVRRQPVPRRRHREEEVEDEDEELASFIVDDDDDYGYSRGPRRNSYSDEISKIFKYDKSRYANDPVYSDDDMEADASDVLREEKRSERIARREDLIEEQKELERLKKRKKNNS